MAKKSKSSKEQRSARETKAAESSTRDLNYKAGPVESVLWIALPILMVLIVGLLLSN